MPAKPKAVAGDTLPVDALTPGGEAAAAQHSGSTAPAHATDSALPNASDPVSAAFTGGAHTGDLSGKLPAFAPVSQTPAPGIAPAASGPDNAGTAGAPVPPDPVDRVRQGAEEPHDNKADRAKTAIGNAPPAPAAPVRQSAQEAAGLAPEAEDPPPTQAASAASAPSAAAYVRASYLESAATVTGLEQDPGQAAASDEPSPSPAGERPSMAAPVQSRDEPPTGSHPPVEASRAPGAEALASGAADQGAEAESPVSGPSAGPGASPENAFGRVNEPAAESAAGARFTSSEAGASGVSGQSGGSTPLTVAAQPAPAGRFAWVQAQRSELAFTARLVAQGNVAAQPAAATGEATPALAGELAGWTGRTAAAVDTAPGTRTEPSAGGETATLTRTEPVTDEASAAQREIPYPGGRAQFDAAHPSAWPGGVPAGRAASVTESSFSAPVVDAPDAAAFAAARTGRGVSVPPATVKTQAVVSAAPATPPAATAAKAAGPEGQTPRDPDNGGKPDSNKRDERAKSGLSANSPAAPAGEPARQEPMMAAALVSSEPAPQAAWRSSGKPSRTEAPAAERPTPATESPNAQEAASKGPVRDITLELGAGAQKVAVRLAERQGELHVAVRTPDPALNADLRRELPALAERLEQSGFRAETWRPEAAPQRHPAGTSGGNLSQDPSGEERRGGEQREQQEQQQQQQQARREDAGRQSSLRKQREEFAWFMSDLR
jgi:hypothetical protein